MTKIRILKGNPSEAEKRAIEIALTKQTRPAKRIWATPILRKELPKQWR